MTATLTVRSVIAPFLAWSLLIVVAALAVWKLQPPPPVSAAAPASEFSAQRALGHVSEIARAPHPLGSEANDAVREYLVSELAALGFNPQVVVANGVHTGSGQTIIARTRNVIGRRAGSASSGAILLTAHYDSVSSGPGAADDAAGVAAILETVRALRAMSPLKNDLIVLFTDGEEAGLLGADAFANAHPWIKDVGLILNLEARGNSGPSLLFETSSNNEALIKGFAESARYPIGSSLFYSLYKLLPNDTDVTVYRSHGIPSMNFAFGENLDAYHSREDSASNLSAASLQQQGSHALALTRYFGNANLTDLKNAKGDDIFFDWLGTHFVFYRQQWVLPGEFFVTALLIWTIVISRGRSQLRFARVFAGMASLLAVLFGVPAVLGATQWLISRVLSGQTTLGDSPANSLLLLGLLFLGAATGGLLLALLFKRFRLEEISLGGLLLGLIIDWALTLLLPAASYLVFWPLLLGITGLCTAVLVIPMGPPLTRSAANVPALLATILLFAPFLYLLYIFLTLQLITALVIGFVLGLFLVLCVPFMHVAVPPTRWAAVLLVLLTCSLTSLAFGFRLAGFTPQHPKHDSIVYSLNADDHQALWVSYDDSIDPWTARFFNNHPPVRERIPNYLFGSERSVLSGPAPALDLSPPLFVIKADQRENDLRKIRMAVRSPRNANALLLRFGKEVDLISLTFEGRVIPVPQPSAGTLITLLGMEAREADLDLTLKAPLGITFWLADRSFGLPDHTEARSPGFAATQASDVTVVERRGFFVIK